MDQMYEYFRKLSEGKLDITKTVEYQFIMKLQELETPIRLDNFARELNMTSIVSHFINLMTKGGLMSQSPYGIDTNVHTPLTPEGPEGGFKSPPTFEESQPQSTSSTASSSSVPSSPDSLQRGKVPPPRSKSNSSGKTPPLPNTKPPSAGLPSRTPPPPSGNQLPDNKSSSVPRPKSQGPPSPTGQPTLNEQIENIPEHEDLPAHIRKKLNAERAKTGSKKVSEDGTTEDDLDKVFDALGSIEKDLED